MASRCLGAIIAAILLVSASVVCDAALIMVYSIQRHGARNALYKTLLLQERETIDGTTLFPVGLRLCFNAGANFRSRYLDPATCGSTNTCLTSTGSTDISYGMIPSAGFNNFNTWVRSSWLDRTLLSAQAFLAGVFPANTLLYAPNSSVGLPTGAQPVPIYSTNDTDDIFIRTYTKCNTYNNVLLNWYQSPEFLAKSNATAALRAFVAQNLSGVDTSLTNWWNVYDSINTYRTYNYGDVEPIYDNNTWTQVVNLAYWLETAKMRNSLVSNYLAGPILADMLRFMDGAQSAVQNLQSLFYKFLSLSTHYNVQLGVLGALALDQYAPAVAALNWLNGTLPQLASVLNFELHSSLPVPSAGGGPLVLAVRLVAQPGPNKTYITVPMPCQSPGDQASALAGPGACSWDAFRAYIGPLAMNTSADWCTACNNTDATYCALVESQNQLQSLEVSTSSDNTYSKSKYLVSVIVGVVVTFLGTLLLCAVIFYFILRRLRHQMEEERQQAPSPPVTSVTLKLNRDPTV